MMERQEFNDEFASQQQGGQAPQSDGGAWGDSHDAASQYGNQGGQPYGGQSYGQQPYGAQESAYGVSSAYPQQGQPTWAQPAQGPPAQEWGHPEQGQQWAQSAAGQWGQPGAPWGAPPPAKKSSGAIAVVALAIVALIVGGAWFVLRPQPAAPEAPVAALAAAPVTPAVVTAAPAPKVTPKPKATPAPTVTKVIERRVEVQRDTYRGGSTSYDPGVKRCSSDSSWGAYSDVNTGTSSTSCAFAVNVRRDYVNNGHSGGFYSYSPTTGKTYWMSCSGSQPVRCTGGINAVIYLGNW